VIQTDFFSKAKKNDICKYWTCSLKLFASPTTGVSYQSKNVTYVISTPSNKNKQKMKIPAVSRVRSKSPTFSPILLQRVPPIFAKKIFIFKIEDFSAVFLRQKLSSTVKMDPSHKNILIYSSPNKYFQIKRRSFFTKPHSREPHA